MDPKIIVGIEREHQARDAIALGVELARATGATLALTGVSEIALGPGGHGYERVLYQETEAEVDRAAQSVPSDVTVTTHVVASTSAVRGLHELAEQTDATMLVLGPTHFGKVARALHGDVTLGMLHAAPCAVAVAPDGFADRAARGTSVIGVAYTATSEGREALEEAVELAERFGARLRIINVATDPVKLYSEPAAFSGVMASIREQGARDLEEARETVATRVPVEIIALEGEAADQLIAASADLDLMVMGSRGYGPTRRVLLGSVSSHIVHQAACAVVVLPRGVRVPVAG
jgi:nucleotide-binding universal stress UspA family protein